jgi:glutaredoxin 3
MAMRRLGRRWRSDGQRSVPQIFINDQYIGGCDDIHDLDARGKLDPLLK